VHQSNFRMAGFTTAVTLSDLRGLTAAKEVPLVADLGSGLLAPDPLLPDEPDAATALSEGADVVTASGDKLLGGPQAGIVLGRADVVARMARHPLARAVRADKLTLAALEATVRAGMSPVTQALHADAERLHARAKRLADAVGAAVVAHDGRVGGGGAPGVPLPGWAVRLPEAAAEPLRAGDPAVLPRVHDGACLVDLRCIREADDDSLLAAVGAALAGLHGVDDR
jgi:L-seryl-tRNA(Ser) seleniumtransferase